jgi:phenylalanyl-tRNA synthetase alpha chain
MAENQSLDIIQSVRKEAFSAIEEAENLRSLKEAEVAFLGKKGRLTIVLRSLKDLAASERKTKGEMANALKKEIEEKIRIKKEELGTKKTEEAEEWVDISAPGIKIPRGHLHPLSRIGREVADIFQSMSFEIAEGPEMETEYYNFGALNIPPHHPARDMMSTFWLKSQKLLLRTHTSPNQIRYMEKHQPPFQVIVPGRCFRYEATDASHDIQFHQLEGLMIGKKISLANLKGVLEIFFQRLFRNKDLKIRFRPSYFPFVEPGVEVDIGLGGRWMEVAGAGMVHPQVLKNAKLDPRQWQGFAFGVGLDRIAMIKYKIDDIRLFYSGDLRFIKQF